MARRLADPGFQRGQRAGTYAEHVRSINEFVDELRDPDGRGWLPHVAPWHGGSRATPEPRPCRCSEILVR
jgi:hypothetical protein